MRIADPILREKIKQYVAANKCSWFIGDEDEFCAMSLYEDGCECRRIVKYELPPKQQAFL
jgi:hypothetical protein